MEFYNKSIEEIFRSLNSNKEGLTDEEAKERLEKFGLNKLKREKRIRKLTIFFNQFKSFLLLILIFAVIVSMFVSHWTDAIVILIIIVFNALFGFFQEFKAEKAIEALKKLTSVKAVVIRDGEEKKILSEEVIPGDILVLSEGDKIVSDARLIEANNLETQEASLTGESIPVPKRVGVLDKKVSLAERNNMVFSGTIITRGNGKAIVIATGMNTEVGKIAKLIQDVKEEKTPLQIKLGQLGKWIGIFTLIVCAVVFILQFLLGNSLINSFVIAISLAVAAVPEGLPAVVTIALALGVQRMIKRKSLIRRLSAVETLGSTSVICTDKTGTLTKNEMTVQQIYCDRKLVEVGGIGYGPEGNFLVNGKNFSSKGVEQLLKIGVLCNNSRLVHGKDGWNIIGDPTEGALLVSARKYGFSEYDLKTQNKRINEIPFESVKRYMITVNQTANKRVAYLKGAPEAVLDLCTKYYFKGFVKKLTHKDKQEILKAGSGMAKNALRVLGFAYKDVKDKNLEDGYVFVGLQGMMDPPRESVRDDIKKANEAGINVFMVTGDHRDTAVAIAKKIGIKDKALTGKDLDNMSDKDLVFEVEKYGVYARVNPEHKLRIVNALKKRGRVVAVTGDGVNDAPALKRADIGIAMGITGTDVSKEASDMVLSDDNFNSIVGAVEEGRTIYDNIQKFVNYLLSTNVGEILIILVASVFAGFFGGVLPLIAIQLLWINLITDGLPALALGVDPPRPNVMQLKPRSPKESIIPRKMTFTIVGVGILICAAVLVLFKLNLGDVVKAQTIAFTGLVVFEIVRLEAIRSHYNLKFFSNKFLTLAIAVSIGLQLLVIYTPLSKIFKVTSIGLVSWFQIIIAALVLLVLIKFLNYVNPFKKEYAVD